MISISSLFSGSATKIERLHAELAGKDVTIQLLRQLLDAKQQEIEEEVEKVWQSIKVRSKK